MIARSGFRRQRFPQWKAAVLFCLSASLGMAGEIYWGSAGFSKNMDSRGREWSGDFTLTLGVFTGEFTPSWENRERWSSAWQALSEAAYDENEGRYFGLADGAVALPNEAGRQVYFWAKNGENLERGPEWMLVTHADWLWPQGGSSSSPALVWTTDADALVIIGKPVDEPGHHLASLAVRPVTIPRETWLAEKFRDRPQDALPHLDPDGDGLSNAEEYLLGSDPTDPSSRGVSEIRKQGEAMRLLLTRNPRAESKATLEASTCLGKWWEAEGELLEDRPDGVEVLVPMSKAHRSLFFRFKLEEAKP